MGKRPAGWPSECARCGDSRRRGLVILADTSYCVRCALAAIAALWSNDALSARELDHSAQILDVAASQMRARHAAKVVADREKEEES
jgi:hypothetical protein